MVRKCRKTKGMVEGGCTYMQLRSRRIFYRNKDLEERDCDTKTSTYQRSTKRKLFEKMENSVEIATNFESKIKEPLECYLNEERSLSTTEEKVKPTEAEIEDFFLEAEKQLQDKFKDKYNFDFEKEKPIEGRYDWVKLSE